MSRTYSAIGDTHEVRYLFSTLDPQYVNGSAQNINYPIAELPCTNVTFTLAINQAGSFSATLNIEDLSMRYANWVAATNPGKSFIWIDIDGVLVYGGRILQRQYQASSQQVRITGTDFYGYWAQRLQAKDYTAYIDTYGFLWTSNGAPAPIIAYQLMTDALAVNYSLPNITVTGNPAEWIADIGLDYWITFSSPLSQQQSVDALVQQLVQMGYGIGCDVAAGVSYIAGTSIPQATTNVGWPRLGSTYNPSISSGGNSLILDLSWAIDLAWDEDASAQSTGIVEQTGASGSVASEVDYGPALSTYNYPLVEQAISHAELTPTALPAAVLAAMQSADQAIYTYPQLAPVVTVPVFGWGTGFSLTNLTIGDDLYVYNPIRRTNLTGPSSMPFPPPGFSYYLRAVQADVTLVEEGVSSMDLTLNLPPSIGPQAPPSYDV